MELFKKYHCNAYMRQGGNKARIETYGMPLSNAEAIVGTYYENGELITEDLSECDGGYIPKTYYERVEKEFDGFLVGTKQIVVSGIIGIDTGHEPIDMNGNFMERRYFFKEAVNATTVGIVYFRNNGKRYVLLDDMELVE